MSERSRTARSRVASFMHAACLGMLIAAPLLAGIGAPEPTIAGAATIKPFPWGSRPNGYIAFSSEGLTDDNGNIVIGGGLFAALRDCAAVSCVYRLTDDPTDHDPAWDPTGQTLWFATEICDSDACSASIGSVDTATGAVSRQLMLTGADDEPTAAWTPAPHYSGSVALTTVEVIPAEFPIFSQQLGLATGFFGRLISTARNSNDTCGGAFASRLAPRWSPVADDLAYIRIDNCGVRVFVGSSNAINATERHIATPLDWQNDGIGRELRLGPAGVDWSPDGTRLVVSGMDQNGQCGVYVVPLAGGEPVRLEGSQGCAVNSHPRWSPDDKFIAAGHTLVEVDGSGLLRECVDGGRCFGPPMAPPAGGTAPPSDGHGVAADPQCTPANCLTVIRIHKRVEDLSSTRPYPATFNFTAEHSDGSSTGSLTLTGDPFARPDDPSSMTALRVKPGTVTVRESPAAGWKPTAIECHGEAVDGVDVDVASAYVTLVIEFGFADCSFTNDPGDFVLPSESPEPSSDLSRCARHGSFSGEWIARLHTVDTLIYHVRIAYCVTSENIVLLKEPPEVTQSIGQWFVPGVVSPISFRPNDQAIFKTTSRKPGQLIVKTSGMFLACTNVAEILGYLTVPLKGLSISLKSLPAGVVRTIVNRLKYQVDDWIARLVPRSAQTDLTVEVVRRHIVIATKAIFEGLVEFLLEPGVEDAWEENLAGFVRSMEGCVSTWTPILEVGIPATRIESNVIKSPYDNVWTIVGGGR